MNDHTKPASRTHRRSAVKLLAGLLALAPLAALAQAPAGQTVKLVVGYAAGGPVDAAARAIPSARAGCAPWP